MNQLDLQIQRNNVARLLEPHSKRERNVVRINTGNTLDHELAKFYLNWKLVLAGHETVTEAIFRGRKARADVLDLDEGVCYELLASESEESFAKKAGYYPPELRIVPLKVESVMKVIREKTTLLKE